MSQRKISPRTGGELFIALLHNLDVKYLFGTTGGAMQDIQDALTEIKPPIWIQGLHEFPSLSTAMGYALASEKPSVCLIDRTVGTMNALGAFYAAYENFSPVVVFSSRNVPGLTSQEYDDGHMKLSCHYHSWQSLMTEPWTKWRHELTRLDMLSNDMHKAFFSSISEPKGPVYMTLREDLMAAKFHKTIEIESKKDIQTTQRAIDIKTCKEVTLMLLESENPLICATSMGRNKRAVPLLVNLANLLGFGFLEGRNFLNFPMEHPLFQGFYSWDDAKDLINESDLIIYLETYFEPPSKPPTDAVIIDIRSDPLNYQGWRAGDYGGLILPDAYHLIGDSGTIIHQITSLVKKHIKNDKNMYNIIKERYKILENRHKKLLNNWKKEIESHLHDEPISPHRISYELNRLWDENTIWVDSTLSMNRTLKKGIMLNNPGTYFTNPSGHLGPMAGAAIGVALAKPNHKVVATIGDGDFIMGNPSSVLWTCSHYQIPVLYIIFNNACWGVEWQIITDSKLKLALLANNYECVDIDEPRINFQRIAESVGVNAHILKHHNETRHVLEQSIKHIAKGEPSLIDVRLPKFTIGKSCAKFKFERPLVN